MEHVGQQREGVHLRGIRRSVRRNGSGGTRAPPGPRRGIQPERRLVIEESQTHRGRRGCRASPEARAPRAASPSGPDVPSHRARYERCAGHLAPDRQSPSACHSSPRIIVKNSTRVGTEPPGRGLAAASRNASRGPISLLSRPGRRTSSCRSASNTAASSACRESRPSNPGVAHRPDVQPNRASCHRQFAQIEAHPRTARPLAHHHEAHLRLPEVLVLRPCLDAAPTPLQGSPAPPCASTDIQRRAPLGVHPAHLLLRRQLLGRFVQLADHLVLPSSAGTKPPSHAPISLNTSAFRSLIVTSDSWIAERRLAGRSLRTTMGSFGMSFDTQITRRPPSRHLVLPRELLQVGQIGRGHLHLLVGHGQDRRLVRARERHLGEELLRIHVHLGHEEGRRARDRRRSSSGR